MVVNNDQSIRIFQVWNRREGTRWNPRIPQERAIGSEPLALECACECSHNRNTENLTNEEDEERSTGRRCHRPSVQVGNKKGASYVAMDPSPQSKRIPSSALPLCNWGVKGCCAKEVFQIRSYELYYFQDRFVRNISTMWGVSSYIFS